MSKKLTNRRASEEDETNTRHPNDFSSTNIIREDFRRRGASGDFDNDSVNKNDPSTPATLDAAVDTLDQSLYDTSNTYLNSLNDLRRSINMVEMQDSLSVLSRKGENASEASPNCTVTAESSRRMINFEKGSTPSMQSSPGLSNTFIEVAHNESDVFLGSSINFKTKTQGFYKIENKELVKKGSVCSWSANLTNQSILEQRDECRRGRAPKIIQTKPEKEITPRMLMVPPKRIRISDDAGSVTPPDDFFRTISTQFDETDFTGTSTVTSSRQNFVSETAEHYDTEDDRRTTSPSESVKSPTIDLRTTTTAESTREEVGDSRCNDASKPVNSPRSLVEGTSKTSSESMEFSIYNILSNCTSDTDGNGHEHNFNNKINEAKILLEKMQIGDQQKDFKTSRVPKKKSSSALVFRQSSGKSIPARKVSSGAIGKLATNTAEEILTDKSEATCEAPQKPKCLIFKPLEDQNVPSNKTIEELHINRTLSSKQESLDSEVLTHREGTSVSTPDERLSSLHDSSIDEMNRNRLGVTRQKWLPHKKEWAAEMTKSRSAHVSAKYKNEVKFTSDSLISRKSRSALASAAEMKINREIVAVDKNLFSESSNMSSAKNESSHEGGSSLSLGLNLPSSIADDVSSPGSPLEPNILILDSDDKKTKKKRKKRKQSMRFEGSGTNRSSGVFDKYYSKTPVLTSNSTPTYVVSPALSDVNEEVVKHSEKRHSKHSVTLSEKSDSANDVYAATASNRQVKLVESSLRRVAEPEPQVLHNLMSEIISDDFKSYISELSANNESLEKPVVDEKVKAPFDNFKEVGSMLLSSQKKPIIKPTKQALKMAQDFLNSPPSPTLRTRKRDGDNIRNKFFTHRTPQNVDMSYYSMSSVEDIEESEEEEEEEIPKGVFPARPLKKPRSKLVRFLHRTLCFWKRQQPEMWFSDRKERIYRLKRQRSRGADSAASTREVNTEFCDIANIPTTSFGQASPDEKQYKKGEALKTYMQGIVEMPYAPPGKLRNPVKVKSLGRDDNVMRYLKEPGMTSSSSSNVDLKTSKKEHQKDAISKTVRRKKGREQRRNVKIKI